MPEQERDPERTDGRATDREYEVFRRRYDEIYNSWRDREKKYNEGYRQMLAQDVGKKKPFRAQVNSQHTHTQIMTHTAFIAAGLTPTFPWVFGEANEPFRYIESSLTEEMNRRLRTAMYYRRLFFWVRDADKTGIGIVKMTLGDAGINMQAVRPDNVAWDPDAEDLRFDALWVIERVQDVTGAMLREGAKGDDPMFRKDAVEKVISSGGAKGDDNPRDDDRTSRGRETYGQGLEGTKDETYTIYYMVTPDRIMTVSKDAEVVLQDIPNPYGYIYYYDLATFPETGDPEGYGIPELGADLQDEINTARRQRIDCRSWTSNPMLKVRRTSGLDIFGQTARPGAVLPVNNADDITPLQVPDTSGPLMQEEALLTNDFDQLVGVMPMTRGQQGTQMKATTANILHGNINLRFAVTMNLIQEYPIRPFLADFMKLSSLDEEPVAVTAPEWAHIVQLVEEGELWLVPHSEAHVGNAMEKFQLLNNWAQVYGPMLSPEGQAEMAKEQLGLIQIRDPSRITKFLQGNQDPDPTSGSPAATAAPGAMSGQGRGGPMVEEVARSAAVGQPPMAAGVGI